ncbi:MAG TPA: SAM-dependent methyltransferase, partial [Vicinamibacteria bacterium]|nr:SAM-dependent methyltransferase [Vicinamibacteria bacterium]
PDRIREARPDYVLILPWNLKDEIVQQMAGIKEWGGRFVVPIPETRVLD